jgi:hypothetical protein
MHLDQFTVKAEDAFTSAQAGGEGGPPGRYARASIEGVLEQEGGVVPARSASRA